LKRENCPTVTLNGKQIPQGEIAKYVGIHLDRRLTWQTRIFAKRKKAGFEIPTNVLGSRKKVGVINREQITDIQNFSKAHLDVRYTPMGYS
jgi:hypothetical protein